MGRPARKSKARELFGAPDPAHGRLLYLSTIQDVFPKMWHDLRSCLGYIDVLNAIYDGLPFLTNPRPSNPNSSECLYDFGLSTGRARSEVDCLQRWMIAYGVADEEMRLLNDWLCESAVRTLAWWRNWPHSKAARFDENSRWFVAPIVSSRQRLTDMFIPIPHEEFEAASRSGNGREFMKEFRRRYVQALDDHLAAYEALIAEEEAPLTNYRHARDARWTVRYQAGDSYGQIADNDPDLRRSDSPEELVKAGIRSFSELIGLKVRKWCIFNSPIPVPLSDSRNRGRNR